MKKITIIVLCFAISVVWVSTSIAFSYCNTLTGRCYRDGEYEYEQKVIVRLDQIKQELAFIQSYKEKIIAIYNHPNNQAEMRKNSKYAKDMETWGNRNLQQCFQNAKKLNDEYASLVNSLRSIGNTDFNSSLPPPLTSLSGMPRTPAIQNPLKCVTFVSPEYSDHLSVAPCFYSQGACDETSTANYFCQHSGYSSANKWTVVDAIKPTRTLGDHFVCNHSGCKQFGSIDCCKQ